MTDWQKDYWRECISDAAGECGVKMSTEHDVARHRLAAHSSENTDMRPGIDPVAKGYALTPPSATEAGDVG